MVSTLRAAAFRLTLTVVRARPGIGPPARKFEDTVMPVVWIPALLRDLTGDQETVAVAGQTVGEVIDALDERFPGIRDRLCRGAGLRPGLAVAVDTQIARNGLSQPVAETSEVHFLPALAGGAGREIS